MRGQRLAQVASGRRGRRFNPDVSSSDALRGYSVHRSHDLTASSSTSGLSCSKDGLGDGRPASVSNQPGNLLDGRACVGEQEYEAVAELARRSWQAHAGSVDPRWCGLRLRWTPSRHSCRDAAEFGTAPAGAGPEACWPRPNEPSHPECESGRACDIGGADSDHRVIARDPGHGRGVRPGCPRAPRHDGVVVSDRGRPPRRRRRRGGGVDVRARSAVREVAAWRQHGGNVHQSAVATTAASLIRRRSPAPVDCEAARAAHSRPGCRRAWAATQTRL